MLDALTLPGDFLLVPTSHSCSPAPWPDSCSIPELPASASAVSSTLAPKDNMSFDIAANLDGLLADMLAGEDSKQNFEDVLWHWEWDDAFDRLFSCNQTLNLDIFEDVERQFSTTADAAAAVAAMLAAERQGSNDVLIRTSDSSSSSSLLPSPERSAIPQQQQQLEQYPCSLYPKAAAAAAAAAAADMSWLQLGSREEEPYAAATEQQVLLLPSMQTAAVAAADSLDAATAVADHAEQNHEALADAGPAGTDQQQPQVLVKLEPDLLAEDDFATDADAPMLRDRVALIKQEAMAGALEAAAALAEDAATAAAAGPHDLGGNQQHEGFEHDLVPTDQPEDWHYKEWILQQQQQQYQGPSAPVCDVDQKEWLMQQQQQRWQDPSALVGGLDHEEWLLQHLYEVEVSAAAAAPAAAAAAGCKEGYEDQCENPDAQQGEDQQQQYAEEQQEMQYKAMLLEIAAAAPGQQDMADETATTQQDEAASSSCCCDGKQLPQADDQEMADAPTAAAVAAGSSGGYNAADLKEYYTQIKALDPGSKMTDLDLAGTFPDLKLNGRSRGGSGSAAAKVVNLHALRKICRALRAALGPQAEETWRNLGLKHKDSRGDLNLSGCYSFLESVLTGHNTCPYVQSAKAAQWNDSSSSSSSSVWGYLWPQEEELCLPGVVTYIARLVSWGVAHTIQPDDLNNCFKIGGNGYKTDDLALAELGAYLWNWPLPLSPSLLELQAAKADPPRVMLPANRAPKGTRTAAAAAAAVVTAGKKQAGRKRKASPDSSTEGDDNDDDDDDEDEDEDYNYCTRSKRAKRTKGNSKPNKTSKASSNKKKPGVCEDPSDDGDADSHKHSKATSSASSSKRQQAGRKRTAAAAAAAAAHADSSQVGCQSSAAAAAAAAADGQTRSKSKRRRLGQ